MSLTTRSCLPFGVHEKNAKYRRVSSHLFALPEFLIGVFLIRMSTIARMLSVVAFVGNAALAAARADEVAAPAGTGNEIPVVDPFFMLSGALLKDGFNGPELDTNLWSRPPWLVENHKTIGARIESGHLVISGPSHPEKQHHQYAGVISKYFRDTDVVLAAEVQVQSPFGGNGRIQHMVHLCSGDYPDFFTEIIFGKIAAFEQPRWHAAYLAKVWEYSGYGDYLEPTRAGTGSEATTWHTVVLTHDGTTSKSQNYLVVDGKWIPIGPSHTVRFNHTHIELKVDVNVPDVPVHMAVDDVRLYPNPAHNPVTIVVYTGVSGNKPKLPIHDQKVQIFEDGSTRLLGEAMTDEGGEARVSLRRDVLFPVAATITVSDDATPIVQARILRQGVDGLYPGDVWALDLRHKRVRKP